MTAITMDPTRLMQTSASHSQHGKGQNKHCRQWEDDSIKMLTDLCAEVHKLPHILDQAHSEQLTARLPITIQHAAGSNSCQLVKFVSSNSPFLTVPDTSANSPHAADHPCTSVSTPAQISRKGWPASLPRHAHHKKQYCARTNACPVTAQSAGSVQFL